MEELRFANELISGLDIDATCTYGQDPPDIIINLGDRKIGLEITKLVVEKTLKNFPTLDNLIKNAEIEYIKRYPNSKVHVIVSTKNFKIKKTQSSEIIDKLILELNNFIEHSKNPTTYFSDIDIVSYDTSGFKIMPFHGAGYEPTISDNIIQESVLKKEKDVHRYKSDFNEIWLLLTMPDASFISAEYHFPSNSDEELSKISNSLFDRIYITRNGDYKLLK